MRYGKLASATIALVLSTSVNAGTVFNISGLENLEWLELTATENMSRLQVENELLSGGQLEGWRYATRNEVETLFDSLWGGIRESYDISNYAGARQYFDAFGTGEMFKSYDNGGYYLNGYTYWSAYFGNQDECSDLSTYSCYSFLRIRDSNFGAVQNEAWFENQYGLSFGLGTININDSWNSGRTDVNFASHLVRVSSVPVLPAVWLFGSGLIGLIGLAKRKACA